MTDRPDNLAPPPAGTSTAPPAAVDYEPTGLPRPFVFGPDGDADADPLDWPTVGLFAVGWVVGTAASYVAYTVVVPRLDVSLAGAATALLVVKAGGGGVLAGLRPVRGLGAGLAASVVSGAMICCGTMTMRP